MTNKDTMVIKENNSNFTKTVISNHFITFLKILGYIFLLLCIWYVLSKKWIYIYLLDSKSKNVSLFFSILVSLTMMLFVVACGIRFHLGKKSTILIIFLVIILLIYGYTDIGLGIEFRKNYDLLTYITYESNSQKGIKFFVFNFIGLWIYVYLLCLVFASDS